MSAAPSERRALVGSTGFVGSNLVRQADFAAAVHRPDLASLAGRHFDVVVCAGAPAEKWRANQDPDADRANLEVLLAGLTAVEADLVVLVSTVDVFGVPVGVDETTPVDDEAATAYGRHRRWLELRCAEHFEQVLVLRLPGLFGPGLKKNVLFDLAAGANLHLTNGASTFQFYDVGRLWADVEVARAAGLDLVHLATEPVAVADLAGAAFGIDYPDVDAPVVAYDLHSVHAAAFGGSGPYLVDADGVKEAVSAWAATVRGA